MLGEYIEGNANEISIEGLPEEPGKITDVYGFGRRKSGSNPGKYYNELRPHKNYSSLNDQLKAKGAKLANNTGFLAQHLVDNNGPEEKGFLSDYIDQKAPVQNKGFLAQHLANNGEGPIDQPMKVESPESPEGIEQINTEGLEQKATEDEDEVIQNIIKGNEALKESWKHKHKNMGKNKLDDDEILIVDIDSDDDDVENIGQGFSIHNLSKEAIFDGGAKKEQTKGHSRFYKGLNGNYSSSTATYPGLKNKGLQSEDDDEEPSKSIPDPSIKKYLKTVSDHIDK